MSGLCATGDGTPMPVVMSTPRDIEIEITSLCNLRCSYCYYFDNEEVEYRDLPLEDWLRFFDECGRANVMSVRVAGGEPFMRKDLKQVLEGIVRNRMRFSILSNGAIIKDDIAAYIASTGRCSYVQVSIDGSCPETHDAMRGKRSFERAMKGIQTLQRHNIPLDLRVTIHQQNVDDLERIAKLLLEDIGASNFAINSATTLGSCTKNADDVVITVAQRQKAMEELLRLSDKYPGRITATHGPLAEAHMWRRMEEARASNAPAFTHGGRLTGCGCHSSKLAVRADGAYSTCSLLAHDVLGYINQDSLVDVWQNSAGINSLRTRHEIELTKFEECSTCEYSPYCTGNCPGLAYSRSGDVNSPSPDGCLKAYLRAGGSIPGVENPPHMGFSLRVVS